MLRDYAGELAKQNATLLLVGVGPGLLGQMRATGVAGIIGEENLFPAGRRLGDSLDAALLAIERRRGSSSGAGDA
ncbi:MAG: hypothetical protein ACK5LO_01195 [Leucobacter sp.]